MSLRRATAAALAALALAMSAHAQDTRIRLHAQAEARGLRYTLGELGEIHTGDAELARALAATEVGLAPRVGQTQSVAWHSIAQRVERSHPQLRGRLKWQGADVVVVRTGGERLDAQALHRLAERTLVDALEGRGLRSDVQAAGRLEDLRLPAGAWQVSARLPEGWAPARRMCVWVDVEIGGRGYRSVPVWFVVKAQQSVHVALQNLRAGEPLREQAVAAQWVEVTALGSAPLAANAPLAGLRLRHAVEAGRPLPAAAVEPRPAVLRNRPVDVQVALGAVRLQTAGIALGDARLGEMVRVRNPASKEQFGALVVAEGTVRVEAR